MVPTWLMVQGGSREGFAFKKQVRLSLRITVECFLPQVEMLKLVTRELHEANLGKLSQAW